LGKNRVPRGFPPKPSRRRVEWGEMQAETAGSEAPGTGSEAPGTGSEAPGTGSEAPGTGSGSPGTGSGSRGSGSWTPESHANPSRTLESPDCHSLMEKFFQSRDNPITQPVAARTRSTR
jgi:hypothetical protein